MRYFVVGTLMFWFGCFFGALVEDGSISPKAPVALGIITIVAIVALALVTVVQHW